MNEALKLICCKLEVSPWQLGVMSSAKGLLAGKVKIFMPENVVIDCSQHADGMLLPHCTSVIERITTDAKYVLLVEKDTVFKKLVQYDISKHFGTECLLITVCSKLAARNQKNKYILNFPFHTGQRLSGHQHTFDAEENLGFA